MKQHLRMITLGFAVALLTLFIPSRSHADSKFWIGGSGDWSDSSNWSPPGQPQDGDAVYLTQSDAVHRVVNYSNVVYPDAVIHPLYIDSTGPGTMTLQLNVDRLRVGNEYIGYDGNGTFVQTGGEHDVRQGNLYLGYHSSATGIYSLSSGSVISDFTTIGVSGTGSFKQTGGFVGTLSFVLGSDATGHGTYNISDGGLTSSFAAFVGPSGTGVINQTGGAVDVDELFVGSKGTYNLSAGTLRSAFGNAFIDGTFNQSGGTHTVPFGGGPMGLGIGSGGTYNLAGGELTVDHQLRNSGSLHYSGGSLHSNLVNDGVTILSGPGTRIINSDITNNGTFKATGTVAVYNGTFTNNGAYISDPATNSFGTLIVSPSGYLTGGAGDTFLINGRFENYSLQNTLWNTMDASLEFTGAADHDFYLAGADLGPNGYEDNFAWDTLKLGEGVILKLFDGNTGNHETALYLDELWGAIIEDSRISNILGGPGLYIYYDPEEKGNSYLDGSTYALAGGGRLSPAESGSGQPVPEPGTMLLLGSGLLGLAGAAKKKLFL